MLVFQVDGLTYVRRMCEDYFIDDENRVHSVWSPCRGIRVTTCLTPTDEGHIRTHTVESDIECVAFDCGFSGPEDGCGSVQGDGEVIVVPCESNTNLIHPYSYMQTVKYLIPKGTVKLSTNVIYPR